jgi:chromosome segregation ATPase
VCPNQDSDGKRQRQDMYQSITALEEQIKWLDQRLSRAELRLKELEAERQGTWKKFSDP